jgi:hypothetical protein
MYKFVVKCSKLGRHLGVLRRVFVYLSLRRIQGALVVQDLKLACYAVETGSKTRELIHSENGGATLP